MLLLMTSISQQVYQPHISSILPRLEPTISPSGDMTAAMVATIHSGTALTVSWLEIQQHQVETTTGTGLRRLTALDRIQIPLLWPQLVPMLSTSGQGKTTSSLMVSTWNSTMRHCRLAAFHRLQWFLTQPPAQAAVVVELLHLLTRLMISPTSPRALREDRYLETGQVFRLVTPPTPHGLPGVVRLRHLLPV